MPVFTLHGLECALQGLDLETRLSIVAVEKSTVAEQFDALARVAPFSK